MTLTKISSNKCFDGEQAVYQHDAKTTNCTMKFGVFSPNAPTKAKCPVIIWLSGLTCTHENFILKTNMQELAAKYGFIVVNPDTSPRGLSYPGEEDHYDFGTGASYYVDALESPWKDGYQMYSYISQEFIQLIESHFSIDNKRMAIMGHSMGGHGALMMALKNPNVFQSVSAFAPICSVINAPWGQKALSAYLGAEQNTWRAYDVIELLNDMGWSGTPIRVDFGTNDEFLKEQLQPERLERIIESKKLPIGIHKQSGYDHSFYFIRTFLAEHFLHHANNLHL